MEDPLSKDAHDSKGFLLTQSCSRISNKTYEKSIKSITWESSVARNLIAACRRELGCWGLQAKKAQRASLVAAHCTVKTICHLVSALCREQSIWC